MAYDLTAHTNDKHLLYKLEVYVNVEVNLRVIPLQIRAFKSLQDLLLFGFVETSLLVSKPVFIYKIVIFLA